MNVDSLSSMLDGELGRPELGRLLRQLEQNPVLREELSRLVLAREVLRGTRIHSAAPGFADRVMAALPEHPVTPRIVTAEATAEGGQVARPSRVIDLREHRLAHGQARACPSVRGTPGVETATAR